MPVRIKNMARSVRAYALLIILPPFAATLAMTSGAFARNVYLNGVDISNAQSQELIGVNVQINEKGDVFIIAPHYQVNEEDTYMPLSSAKPVQNSAPPKHQKPRELNGKTEGVIPPAPEIPPGETPPAAISARPEADGDMSPASLEIPGEVARAPATGTPATGTPAVGMPAPGTPPVTASDPISQATIPKDAQKSKN
jgi:hypothetical protein